MDSFFDYIIIFVIIISILNSIFGKKKKQEQVKTEGEFKPASEKQKHDAVDLLEQMFGIPSQKKEPEYYGESDDNTQTWNPEDEFGETSPKPAPVIETTKKEISKYEKYQSTDFKPLDYHKKINMIDYDKTQLSEQSKKQKELIKKLKNPKSLRDYVLVSEIISKPKAFDD